jgi:riboflavin synthase
MFTGIVEQLGEVVRLDRHGGGGVLVVHCPPVATGSTAGDSIAVDGVCLTVVEVADGTFSADVMKETLARTTLDTLGAGDAVNLERAATPATRLGGHVVQGHVDGVGSVVSRVPGDRWEDVTVALPPDLARYVVEKGSIAVDGVSLTVVAVTGAPAACTVSLIPTTLARTTLGRRRTGDPVNIEVDVIAKYVEKLVAGVRS